MLVVKENVLNIEEIINSIFKDKYGIMCEEIVDIYNEYEEDIEDKVQYVDEIDEEILNEIINDNIVNETSCIELIDERGNKISIKIHGLGKCNVVSVHAFNKKISEQLLHLNIIEYTKELYKIGYIIVNG